MGGEMGCMMQGRYDTREVNKKRGYRGRREVTRCNRWWRAAGKGKESRGNIGEEQG